MKLKDVMTIIATKRGIKFIWVKLDDEYTEWLYEYEDGDWFPVHSVDFLSWESVIQLVLRLLQSGFKIETM